MTGQMIAGSSFAWGYIPENRGAQAVTTRDLMCIVPLGLAPLRMAARC